MALVNADDSDSPDWWLLHLGKELNARRKLLNRNWEYYSGDHPVPEGPSQATEAFHDFQKKSRTNFTREVVEASVARMRVIGVSGPDGKPDTQAWEWWQRNQMRRKQTQLWRASLALSEAYLMVGRDPRTGEDEPQPLITVEHPREVTVAVDPATGQRLAAIKAWYDERAKVARATVFLPEGKVRYVTKRRGPGPMLWGKATWTLDDEEGYEGDLEAVPIVPFQCAPFVGEEPEAEFACVIDVQDRINLQLLNRMTIGRYSAFRQKWVKGHTFETTTDPVSGLEIVAEQPFVADPGAVWTSSGEKAEFGEFGQTQMGDFLRGHQMDIQDLLTISRTPAYTYAGDLVNIAFDTIAAMDTNHVAKVESHQDEFTAGLEETFELAAAVIGQPRDFALAEVNWKDPRQINPAVAADAAVKKKSLGYPLSILAEDLGEPPSRVDRIVSEAAADALMAGAAAAPPVVPEQPALPGLEDGA